MLSRFPSEGSLCVTSCKWGPTWGNISCCWFFSVPIPLFNPDCIQRVGPVAFKDKGIESKSQVIWYNKFYSLVWSAPLQKKVIMWKKQWPQIWSGQALAIICGKQEMFLSCRFVEISLLLWKSFVQEVCLLLAEVKEAAVMAATLCSACCL